MLSSRTDPSHNTPADLAAIIERRLAAFTAGLEDASFGVGFTSFTSFAGEFSSDAERAAYADGYARATA